MFERYTEKARRIIFFARYEASQFGSPGIETEHLLMGLMREGKDVCGRFLGAAAPSTSAQPPEIAATQERIAATVKKMENAIANHEFEQARQYSQEETRQRHELRQLQEEYGVTYDSLPAGRLLEIRRRLEERIGKGGEKISVSRDLPLSQQCKRVLTYAAEESKLLGHSHIGPEHILLGLLREEQSLAAQVLGEFGLRANLVRSELARSGSSPARAASGPEALLAGLGGNGWMAAFRDCGRVLFLARHEAAECRAQCIETTHVLLALAQEKELGGIFPAPIENLREWVKQAAPPRDEAVDEKGLVFTQECKRAFTLAAQAAARAGKSTGPTHVLLGLLSEPCAANAILEAHGFNAAEVLARLTSPPPASDPQQGRDYV
jgi:ATP-dependent Clp protease ATP-binding subunit ClpA